MNHANNLHKINFNMAGSKTSQLSLKQPVLTHTTYQYIQHNYTVTFCSPLLDQKCIQGFGRKPETCHLED